MIPGDAYRDYPERHARPPWRPRQRLARAGMVLAVAGLVLGVSSALLLFGLVMAVGEVPPERDVSHLDAAAHWGLAGLGAGALLGLIGLALEKLGSR